MLYRIFTLHPQIFESFFANSLIARGLQKNIIKRQLINWREEFGIGNYKQVDDKPFGGGTGMVLIAEPIMQALEMTRAVSPLYKPVQHEVEENRVYPNNAEFFKYWLRNKPKKVTVSLTPRGFPLTQEVAYWLANNFEEMNILCGRYEGFDARVSEVVDLELSIGNFILNGGEVAAMCLVESTARLVPGFLTKQESAQHDSFSESLNSHPEHQEYIIGKNRLKEIELKKELQKNDQPPELASFMDWANDIIDFDIEKLKYIEEPTLFDNNWWLKNVAPHIEHPQYTRPNTWRNFKIPEVLVKGNHKLVDNWRKNWYLEP